MPNHLTTVCTVTGEESDVAAFVAAHIREDEWRGEKRMGFDFDTIVPAPQSIKDTYRPIFGGEEQVPGVPETCGDAQVEMYAQCLLSGYRDGGHSYVGYSWLPKDVRTWRQLQAWLDATSPSAAFWGKRMLLAAAETGYPGWFEWNIANWGTKWGAYQYKERGRSPGWFVFEFQTAWSVPIPIFEKLVDMYPGLRFETVTIDEGGPEYEGVFSRSEKRHERLPASDDRYRLVYGEERPEPELDDEDEGSQQSEGGAS